MQTAKCSPVSVCLSDSILVFMCMSCGFVISFSIFLWLDTVDTVEYEMLEYEVVVLSEWRSAINLKYSAVQNCVFWLA